MLTDDMEEEGVQEAGGKGWSKNCGQYNDLWKEETMVRTARCSTAEKALLSRIIPSIVDTFVERLGDIRDEAAWTNYNGKRRRADKVIEGNRSAVYEWTAYSAHVLTW
ncbi:hypothetical protein Fot_32937 [Forsythia ovata]|uniref:Uncharacterized protein n=1 Tax=Forsythia ovata TaxID=205694 RepID=A0ABD1T9C1_9LAMI